MTLELLRRIGRNTFFAGAVAASLFVAACGSSSTGVAATATATEVLTACNVSNSDLQPSSTAGTATGKAVSGLTAKASVGGSSALTPLYQSAGQSFNTANNNLIQVNTATSSGDGLTGVASGKYQIGLSDVYAKEKLTDATQIANLEDNVVAVAPFTLIVSKDLQTSVKNLTTQNIKDIYSGKITSWQELGGPNEKINVIVRATGSGTRFTFDKYVLGDTSATVNDNANGTAKEVNATGDVVTTVQSLTGAIGYAAIGYALNPAQAAALFPICIDGFSATSKNINSGKYKFWAYEHAYTNKTTAADAAATAKAMNDYVLSSDVQSNDVLKLGFYQVSSLSSDAKATHPQP